MNALNAAVAKVKAAAVANHQYNHTAEYEALSTCATIELWAAQKVEQTATVTAECGAVVEVYAAYYAGANTNINTHARLTYKVNGKRAKAADVAELTFAEAVEPAAEAPAVVTCPELLADHAVEAVAEVGQFKAVICRVIDVRKDFYASCVYIGGEFAGTRTWFTREQADEAAAMQRFTLIDSVGGYLVLDRATGEYCAFSLPECPPVKGKHAFGNWHNAKEFAKRLAITNWNPKEPTMQQMNPEPMIRRVTFEDKGQDFLTWYIRDGIVIDCQPHQGSVWVGRKVVNGHSLHVGLKVVIKGRSGEQVPVHYPIKAVEVLGDPEAAKVIEYGQGWARIKGIAASELGLPEAPAA